MPKTTHTFGPPDHHTTVSPPINIDAKDLNLGELILKNPEPKGHKWDFTECKIMCSDLQQHNCL
jgi:hypothetical protein